jgi:hypothetical protein
LEQQYLAKVQDLDEEGHRTVFYTLGVRAELEIGREMIASYLEDVVLTPHPTRAPCANCPLLAGLV